VRHESRLTEGPDGRAQPTCLPHMPQTPVAEIST
jgi:hypothetical protein